MMEFLNFQFMISSLLVKILYALGVIVITIGGLLTLFGESFLMGLGAIVFGNLFWRLFCELIIVTFEIHDRLVSIDKKTSNGESEKAQI